MTDAKRTNPPEADISWQKTMLPGKIDFRYPVPSDIGAALVNTCSLSLGLERATISLRALQPGADPAGHYTLAHRGKTWFIRVTRRKRKNPLLEDLAAFHAHNTGVAVSLPAAAGLSLDWKGNRFLVYAFDYIPARHFNGTRADLETIGKATALLHRALRSFKFAPLVKKNAERTERRLRSVSRRLRQSLKQNDFSYFCERASWAKRNRLGLDEMAGSFDPSLCTWPEAQCVHGELHRGNILFRANTAEAVFTDFEETPDSWFAPSFDLAYLVHRFCLAGARNADEASGHARTLAAAYGGFPADLEPMLPQVCWYTLALLFDRSFRRESISPETEYDKFLRLRKNASLYKG